jgi:hypothetical protein
MPIGSLWLQRRSKGIHKKEFIYVFIFSLLYMQLSSSKEHYLEEHHQKSVVILTKKIIEKVKSHLKADTNIKQITVYFHEHYESLSTVTQNIETLNDTLLRLNSDILHMSNRLPAFTEDINDTKEASMVQKFQTDGMLINQNVLLQDVTAMKQQVEYENQARKYRILDGAMIWKICNVQEKMYDALSERQTSFYSPAFYTSATGYRLCIRLYLNGDGTARGTHLSIFLVVLRGQYDALLQWPFSYRVSFCFFDQRTIIESDEIKQAKHIIESFRPDTRSISFQRPCSSMNIASGIPKFFALANFNQPPEINRYIINDTIFIKVFIDFIGIPKSMLSFIFSLNVALPIHVQQKLIDDELKRREEQNIN